MKLEIIVRPEAAREIQEAFDWYEERSEGLGLEFLRAADACLAGISRNPLGFLVAYQEVHRALLRKFPYALFYILKEEKIIVLACFHTKRSPVDWMRRV
ncbi:MAG: type II toxin-antitoxin system RelE/ParE family toxin [Acidobacteriota bacterium]|nr:type II toxin-antitoxin system RelE/ParE family toxin [Acidobacteriota bacterium]